MRLATILPIQHLHLEDSNHYHMALAHLVPRSEVYSAWFREMADRGDHVIMDNGIVENDQRSVPELITAAETIGATEVILPDQIGSAWITLDLGRRAIEEMQQRPWDLMAVPQGAQMADWDMCLKEMLRWPIVTIGFSKFITIKMGMDRRYLLSLYAPEILRAGKQIHMLGSPSGAIELAEIRKDFPMVRGADTGYPSFCTTGGVKVRKDGRRPDVEVDWLSEQPLDEKLMNYNRAAFRKWIGAT